MSNRREHVPFDPFFFEKQRLDGTTYSTEQVFSQIYRSKHWNGGESVSGEGASKEQTVTLEEELPALLKRLGVDVLLDLPCGDFSWMGSLDLPVKQYVGVDIVSELVQRNQQRYGNGQRRFVTLNLIEDPLPAADLILCRDCLVHFSLLDIQSALSNIKNSSIKYLLATTFPECQENEDITTGDWRLLNLQKEPFDFPEPRTLLVEGCCEGEGRYQDKSLGLWKVEDLAIAAT